MTTPVREQREAPRDWSKWLPPRDLPDTGPKDFKRGQIWAFRYTKGASGVVKITAAVDERQETLACGYPGLHKERLFLPGGTANNKSVLVADVGCEPTPPEILYGASQEGPPKPARGQRWRTPLGNGFEPYNAGRPFTLTEYSEDFGGWFDDGNDDEGGTWDIEAFADGRLTFVDHGPNTGVVMEERCHADDDAVLPVGCLNCGAPVENRTFCCAPCIRRGVPGGAPALLEAWKAGARDFPRRPTGSPPVGAAPKRVPPQGISWDEHRNINGVAMSALEFIKARKPPEPWRPSVDEWDLLPDAGTSYRTPSKDAGR